VDQAVRVVGPAGPGLVDHPAGGRAVNAAWMASRHVKNPDGLSVRVQMANRSIAPDEALRPAQSRST
jgi:hypothetical protein